MKKTIASIRSYLWPIISGLLIALFLVQNFPSWVGLNAPLIEASSIKEKNLLDVSNQERWTNTETASYAHAVSRAASSVVNIYTIKATSSNNPLLEDPFFRQFLSRSNLAARPENQNSLGSGVIVSPQGYIVTSHHVIKGADQIIVLLHDGREAEASLVGVDEETDLAVLQIPLDNLVPISIGDPSSVHVGDVVLAIGNPFGIGQTVTQGIISATGRNGLGLSRLENFIQTDAAINPGNSGGALIDAYGNLIGINAAVLDQTGSYGVGFATPADTTMKVVKDLVEKGVVARGWMGVEAQQLSLHSAESLGINPPRAMMITGLYPFGPGEKAGLLIGDIITSINGKAIADGRQVVNLIADTAPGETLTLSILRDQRPISVTISVENRPQE